MTCKCMLVVLVIVLGVVWCQKEDLVTSSTFWNEFTAGENELSNAAASASTTSSSSSSKILFLKNSTSCIMYSKKCYIRVILTEASIKKSLKIKTKSKTKKFIEFKTIDACLPSAFNMSVIRRECRLFDNYTLLYKPNQLFVVRVRAKLVGTEYLEFEYFDSEKSTRVMQTHTVIVTRPERFIDDFQMVYIVVFSIFISVIMGILLDVDTLIKIIKMPFPVLIGFVSQYLFMPMVIFRLNLPAYIIWGRISSRKKLRFRNN